MCRLSLSPRMSCLLRFLIVTTIFAATVPKAFAAQAPANLDFEEGEVGKVPVGWTVPASTDNKGFTALISEDNPKSGQRCVLLSRDAKGKDAGDFYASGAQGKLTQSVDAAPYRGKRVSFRVAARCDAEGYLAGAQFLVRISPKAGAPSFYDDMADRPIVQKEWRDYQIVAEVAEDSDRIDLELILKGNEKAWFDAVRIEVIGKAGEGNEPARALDDRSLDNLVAFARLLGYVRYFHPSDEAATTDWNAFAHRGVKAVEKAKNPQELAAALDKLFRRIAPPLRVHLTGAIHDDLPSLAPPAGKDNLKVVYWRHYGVGTGTPGSIYSSQRVNSKDPVKPVRKDKLPDEPPPDPAKPLTVDLGGGVSCWLPLSLYGDGTGTYPRLELPPAGAVIKAADDGPASIFFTGNDRATRLAAVVLTWNVFQHFYPYFDVVQTDWPAELRKALKAAATDPNERAFLDTLRRMVAALHDGHGRVNQGGFRYQETFRPPFQWDWVEERLAIVHAPADSDLKPGDVVTKIEGRPAPEEIAQREELISSATPQYRRYVALAELAHGVKDSELKLEILSPAGKTRAVKLRRTVPFNEFQEKRPEKIAELKPGVMYVDIDRITDAEFRAARPKLAEATGIVFDLRGYPRRGGFGVLDHLTDKPVNCAQWHIPFVLRPDHEKMQFAFSDWKVKPAQPRFKAKVAFLTDGRAISAAETILGIVEKHHLAEIVGTPTAGTNGNVNPFTVPGGYRISWTGMKVLKQDGARHHGVGITPTVLVNRTLKGLAEGRDEQLERAVELVSGNGS